MELKITQMARGGYFYVVEILPNGQERYRSKHTTKRAAQKAVKLLLSS